MRTFLPALLPTLALLFAAAPAGAGGAEEFFMGRPPSVGVVHGGAFGSGGFDYDGELPHDAFAAPRVKRGVRRVTQAARMRRGVEPSLVARPYFRP